MDRLQADLRAEYDRWRQKLESYREHHDLLVSGDEVLRAHFLLLDAFGGGDDEQGYGGVGPRDLNLLLSAVDRQAVGLGSVQKWPEPLHRVATVYYGLAKNHAFHDGNKRTALLTALHGLWKIGLVPAVRPKELESLTVAVAASDLPARKRFTKFRRRYGSDAEVHYLASELRSATRKVDTKDYVVTFRQLDAILRRFGLWLDHPKNNYIDVYQRTTRRSRLQFLGRKDRVTERRIMNIGFPGWNREVSKAHVKQIRRKAGLLPENGCDSQVFFKDIDPMESMIGRYYDVLLRLADR